MNILTFDIEEWYIAKQDGILTQELRAEYDDQLDKILRMLKEKGRSATFFCVGRMARDFPDVIRKIEACGYEIGCHSNIHTWLNKMSVEECRQDTKEAIDILEQCIGKKIVSYRAPAFSVGEANKWVFEILAENGIVNDSSVFPATRDFGGFPKYGSETPTIIEHNGIRLKEFPIPMCHIMGRKLAYSGGGYLRLFPLSFIQREMKRHPYSMIYLHIADLLTENNKLMSKEEYEEYFKEPGTLYSRYKRYIKANIGKSGTWNKLASLVADIPFESVKRTSDMIDWENLSVLKL